MMVTSKRCVKATCTCSKTKEAVSWHTPSYMVYKFTCPLSVENKYGWGEEEVATFMFYYSLVYSVGLWIGVHLLTRIFHLSDNTIAIIASITSTAGTCTSLTYEEEKGTSTEFLGYLLPVFTDKTEWLRIHSFVLNWLTLSSLLCALQPVLIIATRFKYP